MNSQESPRIWIEKDAWNLIQAHVEAHYPEEACGFLFGKDHPVEGRQIVKALSTPNIQKENRKRRFEINPLDYLKAEQYAEQKQLQLLGIFHSHPDHPAIPSRHDLKQALPYFSYPIVSVAGGKVRELRFWKLKESEHEFEEEFFTITQS